jgi:hypothetical protein
VFLIYTHVHSCLSLLYELYHFYSTEQMNSDDEVQEIDPPVIIRSGRKKYRRRILKEELNIRFCRRSKRNNKDVEDSRNQDQNANLDFTKNSSETNVESR